MSVEQHEGNLDLNQLLLVLRAAQNGDFAPRMNEGGSGLAAEVASAVNALQAQNQLFVGEVERMLHETSEGVLGGQADVPQAAGQWKSVVDSLNSVAVQLCSQVRGITSAFSDGKGGKGSGKVTMPGEGEFALLRDALNTHLEHDRA
jgi:hypothetical protein